jgi:hypothetical protein
MKQFNSLLFALVAIILVSCESGVTEKITYKINEPVFMTKEAFRASVKVNTTAEEIVTLGKICFFGGYLYISEPQKGIHIIDNRNPSSPQNIGFIEVLGNADLAIRDNLLYADSFVDLVWFDITNPSAPTLKGRLNDIFPTALPVMINNYGYDYSKTYEEKDNGIVVGWNVVERTEDMKDYRGSWWGWGGGILDDRMVYMAETSMNPTAGSSNGVNGSMSRFTLYDNKLYVVLNNYMSIFDLTGTQPIKAGDSMYIGGNVETIFSYKDNMFIGTPTGMLIYSVKDPLKPEYQSNIWHVFGCDPVVVDNDLAYVTVHSGNNCGQNINELFIVDVEDVKTPKKLVSFAMTNPKGLGIDANKLFLCDDGLKIFQITDKPANLLANQIKHIQGMEGFDLIPFNNTLMMIAEDGLYQYDYSNTSDIRLLSKLSFAKK